MAGILDWFAPQQAGGMLDGQQATPSTALLMGGLGMLSGQGMQDGFGKMAVGMGQGMQQDRLNQQMREQGAEKLKKAALAKKYAEALGRPELAEDYETAQSLYVDKNKYREPGSNLTSDLKEYEYAKKEGFQGAFTDFLQKKRASSAGGYGMTPIYGTGPDGKPVIMQLGPQGEAVQTRIPEGVQVSTGVEKIDLGTEWGLYDRRSGQMVGRQPKDIAGKARQEQIGEAEGKAVASAPGQLAAADDALNVINQIKTHPNRTSATGWQSNFPTTKGGKTADFENLVEQAKSGAFLTAIGQLRGLGALSDAEGRTATAAITRMNLATSDEGFLKAVEDYEAIVMRGKKKAEALMGQRGQGQQGSPRIMQHPSGATIERID